MLIKNSLNADGGAPAGAPLNTSGTASTRALHRLGCRKQSCMAEGAPAETPNTATFSSCKASSRLAWASACAMGEASLGSGVRR